jgi:opacity protein-like surface antigen
MKARALFSAALFAAILPAAAQAQVANPFSLEVRGGAGVPTGEFGKELETGWSAAVNGSFRFTPSLGVYAGYSYTDFGMDVSGFFDEFDVPVSGVDLSMVSSGFDAGVIAYIPGVSMVEPWVRGGVILHQMQFKASAEGMSASEKGDFALGFEVGGGVAVPITPRISITPGVTYRSYKPKFEGESSNEAMTDLGLDVGIRIRF